MITLEELAAGICRRAELTTQQLRDGTGPCMRDARHTLYYCALQRGFSSVEVASWLGVDHCTVLRGVRRMEALLAALVSEGA